MLNRDPKTRINAREALSHAWFTNENNNGENVLLDVGEGMADLEQQMVFDQRQMNDEQINLVSVTPVMAPRKLNNL